MKQEAERRARLIRASVLSVNVVGQEHRFDDVGFVIAIQKLAQAAGEKCDQLSNLGARNCAKSFADAKQIGPAPQALRIDLRWWFEKERLQVARLVFAARARRPRGAGGAARPAAADALSRRAAARDRRGDGAHLGRAQRA